MDELTVARGDGALAERIVAELGVRSGAGAEAGAGWGGYLRHLGAHLQRALLETVAGLLETVPLPAGWPRTLALIVAAAALALVLALALRAYLLRRRRPASRPPAAAAVVVDPADPAVEARGAGAWRAELDALLAAGRIAEALRATWWWLARALAGEGADPAWTGRELLERSGRRDLLPLLRRLESLTFGRGRAAAAELRRLVAELEGAVG